MTVLRRPTFALAVILVLGLGVAVSTLAFTVLEAFLLRPLPFREADRLVWLETHHSRTGTDLGMSFVDFKDLRSAESFEDTAFLNLRWNGNIRLGDGTEAETLRTTFCTWNLLELMGVRTALGRGFRAEDDAPDAPRTLVISHAVWTQVLGSAPDVIGRTLNLDGEERQIIGVLPPGVRFPAQTDLWVPTGERFQSSSSRGNRFDRAIARLRPGVSREAAEVELRGIAARLARDFPDSNSMATSALVRLRDASTSSVRPSLYLVFAASACLLLISCANVGAMFLAAGVARAREFGIRSALGATRSNLVRQLLREAFVLAGLGGAFGTAVAAVALSLLARAIPTDLPYWIEWHLDLGSLAFALGCSFFTAVGATMLSARRILAGAEVRSALMRGSGASAGTSRWQPVLVGAQIALSFVLLSLGAALVRHVFDLGQTAPGFEPRGILLVEVNPTYRSDEPAAQRVSRFEQLLATIRNLPGVVSVAANNSPPFIPQRPWNRTDFTVEGQDEAAQHGNPIASFQTVSADYFRTLKIPLLRGRAFQTEDTIESTRAAIISRALAERVFGTVDPLGQRFQLGPIEDRTEPNWRTIVGVVGDLRHQSLEGSPVPDIYFASTQLAWKQMHYLVRVADGIPPLSLLPAIRRECAKVSADTGIFNAAPLERLVSDSLWQQRLRGWLVSGFSSAAIALACAGLAALAALHVTQRRREFGIRLALGALAASLSAAVITRSLRLTAIGLAFGAAGAFAGARLAAHFDPAFPAPSLLSLTIPAVIVLAVSLLASALPARRAARVNPVAALRAE